MDKIDYSTINHKINVENFQKNYKDLLSIKCGLIFKIINQITINEVNLIPEKNKVKNFENEFNKIIIEIDNFINKYEKELIPVLNKMFNPLDLMLNETLNDSLSFDEKTEKKENLKTHTKQFTKIKSEVCLQLNGLEEK